MEQNNNQEEKELESKEVIEESNDENQNDSDKALDTLESTDEKEEQETVDPKEKKKMTLEKGISMAKFYSLATQGIINMAVMAGLGYLIGYFTLPNTPWPPIFSIIGLLGGLFTFISYVLFLNKGDNKNAKNKS